MADRSYDIFIAGGGIAGLVAAAALSQSGATICLADPALCAKPDAAAPSDLRSTAYLQPSQSFLNECGLWDIFAPLATPLLGLRIIDSQGWPPEITETRHFDPQDLGYECFGWNIQNGQVRPALLHHLSQQSNVDIRFETGFESMLARSNEALVNLTDGTRLRARLVVGADGRASGIRDAVGIDTDIRRYGQSALAFTAAHAIPHHGISTEIYNHGGAFTTVPVADIDGAPASAIVWMNDRAQNNHLCNASTAEFDTRMTQRAVAVLGPMTRLSPLHHWPVITQCAKRLVARRTALIAEAAHVLPPIGAQGLNTSLLDIAALTQLAHQMPDTLGSDAFLDRYAQIRAKDVALKAAAIDLFNRICKSDAPLIQATRRAGLKLAHDVTPLRKTIMRFGLGAA